MGQWEWREWINSEDFANELRYADYVDVCREAGVASLTLPLLVRLLELLALCDCDLSTATELH